MLDDASLSAATAAGAAVAGAATTERWAVARPWAARLLAKGDPQAEREHLARLDSSAAPLRLSYEPELRTRFEAALQTRFELLLEESAGMRRAELVAQFVELARASAGAYAAATPTAGGSALRYRDGARPGGEPTAQQDQLTLVSGIAYTTAATPAAPGGAPGGALPYDVEARGPATLVGRIPEEAAPFWDRTDAALPGALFDGPAAVCALTGPAGVGKSQLAARFARRAVHDGSADLVLWVTATSGDALVCAYADAAAATTAHDPGQPERSAEAFRSWLSWTDLRWLVVFDGVPDTADLHGSWPPARPNGRVLVTARRATSLPDGSGCVEVGPYLPEEAAGQLTRELLAHGRSDDPVDIAALAADLRRHPLALSTAAACMAQSGLTCAGYRDRLARLAGPGGAGPTRDALTAGWWTAIGTADRQSGGLARALLELTAVLDPHGIPVAALTSRPALHHLARRRVRQAARATDPAGAADPAGAEETASSAGASPPWEVTPLVEAGDVAVALDVLRRLRLVEGGGDAVCPTVRLSSLVQTAVRRAVPVAARDALALSAADALRAVWRTAADQPQSVLCRGLRSATDALTGHAKEVLWRGHCHPVLFQVGRNLIDAGLVRAARIRWDWLHARLHQRFGPDHPDTLAARGHQARVRGASQDAAGAVAAYRDLLHDLERVLGHDSPDVFTVRDNLARWQGVAGDPARAAAAYADLLADRLLVLGGTHADTLLTRHNIALWRGRAGDAAGAAAAYAELLDDMVRAFDANHPAVLETRDQLTEWRNKAADMAAAALAPATTGPHPDQPGPYLWSPPLPDVRDRPQESAALSAQQLLQEPPWSARLLRRLTRRGRPAGAGPRTAAHPASPDPGSPDPGPSGPGSPDPGSPIAGCHRVSVISLKGGTGKTTTAAALGATLAGARDDPVIAVDASPEGGTLGHRVRREHDSTILDLLARLPELDGHDDIRRFTATGPDGLEVLAHDVAPALSTPFGAQQYHRVVDALSRAYPVIVTDSGTGLMQEAMRGVLALTDQLVVVATASVDGAAVADVTLDWLSKHGHAELAQRALVVLSAVHPGATLVRTDRIIEHFAGRCRGVVTVPFDEHLAAGAELDPARLRPDTRRAYAELAALVAEDFTRAHAPGATRPAGPAAEPIAAAAAPERHPSNDAPPGPPGTPDAPEPPGSTPSTSGTPTASSAPGTSSTAATTGTPSTPGSPEPVEPLGPAPPPQPAPPVEPAAAAGPASSTGPGDAQPPGEDATPPRHPHPPGAPHRPRPRPPRRTRLTVEDDPVRIGTPTTLACTLAVTDPRDAELDTTEPVSVLLVATSRSSATLEPSVVSCATDDARPARFTFTAWEAGEHRLRFRVYDPECGKVLQVVEATLPVPAPEPLGRP